MLFFEQERELDMDKWVKGRVLFYLRSNCANLMQSFERKHVLLNGKVLQAMSVTNLSSFFVDGCQIEGLNLYYKIHPTKVSASPYISLLLLLLKTPNVNQRLHIFYSPPFPFATALRRKRETR